MIMADELRRLIAGIVRACGAPPEEADIVADELVETNLMGFDSHGALRIVQYVGEVASGKIVPGAPIAIVQETAVSAIVDCGHNFGAVSADRMARIALEKAAGSHMACVTGRRSRHVGRLGAWVQQIAEQGMIGLAFAGGYKGGHVVAPWGGREGRLATNPLAYAAPTGGGQPIVFDMATSMIAEGSIRLARNKGETVPPGCMLDAEGRPSVAPDDFYGPPRGTILPFGGAHGYKGFGLGLLVDLLGSVLAGVSIPDDTDYTNGLCLIAIDPDAFVGRERFVRLMDEWCAYIVSCPPAPGFEAVQLPGAPNFRVKERRLRDGIPIDDATWAAIAEAARSVGCAV
ncbi:Ldh family oxidoreductase [Paenibacillus cymbidii]|uniref:Ldh family oxidoreductase n=1 Tax=Paenibacillus cymbidii TaxID=1639034 RepID=UPI001F38D67C|nr:Ldh family oxidoreductase [Paenibacillus cymbidii]